MARLGTMLQENAMVVVYNDPQRTREAVKELERAGFNLNQLSVVGAVTPNGRAAVACYSDGHSIRCWGERGILWNSLCSVIKSWAFLSLPGIGPMLVSGPLALWIIAALENAAIFSNLSALGATLYSIGIPKDRVQDYETALQEGNYLLIAHGPAREITRARKVLTEIDETDCESVSTTIPKGSESPDAEKRRMNDQGSDPPAIFGQTDSHRR
jgi:hypothetical protein